MSQNRKENDAQSRSYKEFKKNAERKIWEDNLKALEDESKRSLFPAKDDHRIPPHDELWKKGMVKNIDGKVLREEDDSLSEDDLYNLTISFENLMPETVGWIMGRMNSYIHIASVVDIEPVTEARKGWRHLLEAYDEPNIGSED